MPSCASLARTEELLGGWLWFFGVCARCRADVGLGCREPEAQGKSARFASPCGSAAPALAVGVSVAQVERMLDAHGTTSTRLNSGLSPGPSNLYDFDWLGSLQRGSQVTQSGSSPTLPGLRLGQLSLSDARIAGQLTDMMRADGGSETSLVKVHQRRVSREDAYFTVQDDLTPPSLGKMKKWLSVDNFQRRPTFWRDHKHSMNVRESQVAKFLNGLCSMMRKLKAWLPVPIFRRRLRSWGAHEHNAMRQSRSINSPQSTSTRARGRPMGQVVYAPKRER